MSELFVFWTIAGSGALVGAAIADSLTGGSVKPEWLILFMAACGPVGWFGLAVFVIAYRTRMRELRARGQSHE